MADNEKRWGKTEQNDPNGPVLKWQTRDLPCGETHQISIFYPCVVVDSHMHIQSGRCAPLPFLRDRTPVLGSLKLKRSAIETTGKGLVSVSDFVMLKPVKGLIRRWLGREPDENGEYYQKGAVTQMVKESGKKTFDVGADFIVKRNIVFDHFLKEEEQYKHLPHLVFLGIVMTMDMEYAHIDGYFGIKVYNAVYQDEERTEKPLYYWYPRHGMWQKRGDCYQRIDKDRPLLPAEGQTKKMFDDFEETASSQGITGAYHDLQGKRRLETIKAMPCLVPDEETDLYEPWKAQVDYTERVVLANPLKLLPMFHYDPRRWQLKGNAHPFEQVGGKGLYLGFKMYTAQGYRPWDPRLPILKDFYAECCAKQIPIMNHCTPEGAPSFDREDYFHFVHPNDGSEDQRQKDASVQKGKVDYFNRNFVAPDAWREVLDRPVNGRSLHTLRICLAHFGGNTELGREWGRQIIGMIKSKRYPNLYADISSSFADNAFREYFRGVMVGTDGEYLKDRILFGTDWYLTLLDGVNYPDYCREAKKALDKFDTSLWPRFTQYNPYRFYRLDEQIDHIANNIITIRQKVNKKNKLNPLSDIDITKIRKEAAYIKAANRPFIAYMEVS